MIIVSQDKKKVINTETISYIGITESRSHVMDADGRTRYWIRTDSMWIGEYSTEAKAVKVLNGIASAMERYYSEYDRGSFTYRLPADEEV